MAFEIVVVGTSMGGLAALERLLAGLPPAFPLPLAVVQHRRAGSNGMLATLLRRCCALPVREPHDKEKIEAGRVYLAPADYHLLIEEGEFALSTEGPVRYSRPSIDVLFASAADTYGKDVIGVVLTGANDDGAQGAARIKAAGGLLIVQSPETAESAVMPRAALAAAAADKVLPLSEIAPCLVSLCPAVQKETL
ncbi:MAG TPA: chemotaxis protein CheB [Chthonomonadaceae bacterium]|nr:chemotaxis protein CheB [Chthonomonadaceae bacterium]